MTHFSIRPETVIAGDEIGGVWHPRVKLSYGDGCGELSEANPLPVTIISGSSGGSSGGLTNTELRASAVPVSGTFYQATQPVSGTVTVGNASLAVTGAFYQATQPISGNVGVTGSVAVTGSFYQATQPVSIAATVPTRDLKDNGRTLFSAATVIGGVAAVSSEALLSLVATRAGVAAGGATSLAVTSGKTLRATAIIAGVRSTGATVLSGRVALRMNPSGAVIATSPIIAILSMTQQAAALAEAGDTCVLPLPDGLEFSGTQQIGLTQVCSGTGGVVYGSIMGFEY